jgi:hypothetical protein
MAMGVGQSPEDNQLRTPNPCFEDTSKSQCQRILPHFLHDPSYVDSQIVTSGIDRRSSVGIENINGLLYLCPVTPGKCQFFHSQGPESYQVYSKF